MTHEQCNPAIMASPATLDVILEMAEPGYDSAGRVLLRLALFVLIQNPPRGGAELLAEAIAAAEAGDVRRARIAIDRFNAVAVMGPERAGKGSTSAADLSIAGAPLGAAG